MGAEILQEDIRKYVEINQYDETIIKAIKNHNKFKIEEGLTEKEKLFAKIIRDADKIDILYESVEIFWKEKEQQVEESIISVNVVKQFQNLIQVKNAENFTPIDDIIRKLAFIFDINFKSSFELLGETDYINKILDRYSMKDEYTKQKIEEIRNIANEYIQKQMK